jgi:hypothetical protein
MDCGGLTAIYLALALAMVDATLLLELVLVSLIPLEVTGILL